MSIQRNKELVHRWHVDGWGKGDIGAMDEVFAPDHVVHWNEMESKDQQRTPAQVKNMIVRFREAIPDLSAKIDDIVATDNKVAFQVTYEGTHTGQFGDIPASNKHFKWTDMIIAHIENGKVIELTVPSRCGPFDVMKRLAETD